MREKISRKSASKLSAYSQSSSTPRGDKTSGACSVLFLLFDHFFAHLSKIKWASLLVWDLWLCRFGQESPLTSFLPPTGPFAPTWPLSLLRSSLPRLARSAGLFPTTRSVRPSLWFPLRRRPPIPPLAVLWI